MMTYKFPIPMAKLNKLHKRHLVLKFEIVFMKNQGRCIDTETPREEMTLECDIPRRWDMKRIMDFAFSHINRRGRTENTGKEFKVETLTSVVVVFPDDSNREISLYSHDTSRDS